MKIFKGDSPCGDCAKPELEECNITAWQIYGSLNSQPRIAGLGAFVGYDFSVLHVLFQAYGVPLSDYVLYLDKMNVLNDVATTINRRDEELRAQQSAKKK